jgi:hypothetical protein
MVRMDDWGSPRFLGMEINKMPEMITQKISLICGINQYKKLDGQGLNQLR